MADFISLNGYMVKDAKARELIEGLAKKGTEITRAEYDSLIEEMKNNGLYYIKDENLIIYNGVSYMGGSDGLVGIELTEAEYNELPEEEKNVGLYFITDGNYIINNGIPYGGRDSDIIYEEYEFAGISFEAGTVSTRANQYTKDIAKDGYKILSTTITYILESSLIIPIQFLSGSTLYLNIYRATANSMTNNSVRITVAYEKI